MLYPVYTMSGETVGIRELRRGLSQYVERAERGESFRISHRGRVVATLAPLTGDAGPVERLLAAGRIREARHDLAKLGRPKARKAKTTLSEALIEERGGD